MNNIKNVKEAKIKINGIDLTTSQVITIKVALTSFHLSLKKEGLGDDDHGKNMTKLYLERIHEINHILFSK